MPDVSVTITPTGPAYQAVRQIIDALRQQCPEHQPGSGCGCSHFEPHLTLQYVRDAPDPDAVVRLVERVVRGARPFEVRLGALGVFDSPPGVHVEVEPTPPLLRLYERLKTTLREAGFATYGYDVTTWRPHMTLSCRHWSRGDLSTIRSMFGRFSIAFQAERVQVSRLERAGDGARWVVLRDLPLGGGARRARRHAA